MSDKTPEELLARTKERGAVLGGNTYFVFTPEELQAYAAALQAQPVQPTKVPAPVNWSVQITNDYKPQRLKLTIGVQSFDIAVDYAENEPDRLKWFCDMLTKAMTKLTKDESHGAVAGQVACRCWSVYCAALIRRPK